MCGIFGYIGKRTDAATIVFNGIKTLEYRGYDSWGVGVVAKEKTSRIIVKKQIGKIGTSTITDLPASSLGIGHTRWATHGGVTQKNAHPHMDCSSTIALIHNGIIENYDDLKKNLKNRHTFVSETDSEVAAHMIEELLPTLSFEEAVRKTFCQFQGSNAIVVIQKDKREIVAIRNGSPLVVGFGQSEQFVASDATGLLAHTNMVYFLEDNEMAVLTDEGITIFDALTGTKKSITPTKLSWTNQSAEKNTYDTFMEKEMHEQPDVLQTLLTRNEDVTRLNSAISQSKGAYLIGCGSAYYACLAGSYLFSTIAKRHMNTCVASEFTYQEDFLNKDSLVIALSQSGETMDLIDAVKIAKTHTASLASIVNVEGSSLWRMSDIKIPCGVGPEVGVASTKDMTAKIAILLLAAYAYGNKQEEGEKILTHVITSTRSVLEQTNIHRIQEVAAQLKNASHLFVVGRGLSYPAALEAAMKIKEISYIHAEGLAAGELKHGPIALIEEKTPCIVLLPNDETYGANLAAAMEMKARGGHIIGLAQKPHEVFDTFLPVLDAGPGTIIPNIITCQLLAYYLARARGLDADKPRNLAKSVTVK